MKATPADPATAPAAGSAATHVFDHDPASLADRFAAWGLRSFRAKQVLDWVYRRGEVSLDAMTNLSRADRETLRGRLVIERGEAVRHQLATDGTQKLLLAWDGLGAEPPAAAAPAASDASDADARPRTECVMIPADSKASGKARRTGCISSQVGCPVGCRFCASGMNGLEGNLTAGQIVEQAWRLGRLDGQRLTNVVFMGMGEPLANFAAVAAALRALTADWGLGLSARKITVSTVGVPSGIRRLAAIDLPVTLAVSLHAPNDDIRRRIIPWAQFVSIDRLIAAGRDYFDATGREVTLEYILLGGVNDRVEHARELADVAKQLRSNVNLIRYNEVAGIGYQRPATEDVRRFRDTLANRGVNVHLRASRGRDIAAACGQLRRQDASARAARPVALRTPAAAS